MNSAELLERLKGCRPRNRAELKAYVKVYLGLDIPSKSLCENHCSPLDYLAYALGLDGEGGRDCVVWANRGGGKTRLGALASLLESVFYENCQSRILGGSEEQSRRMYDYLQRDLRGPFAACLAGVTAKACAFKNGSGVQVLAQSHRSVRGHHVQRLRCDEVELFDREVFEAAQFVTQSSYGIAARLEILSTMHRPFGLMQEIVQGAGAADLRVFNWCLWEVIEKCVGRECSVCPLYSDCQGRAKEADGYYSIDDAIAQKRRSSEQSWKAEMLCLQSNRHDLVFPEFSPAVHVQPLSYNPQLATYRSFDFGFTNPLACLLIQITADDRVLIIGEHIKSRTTLAEHARLIKERWPYPIKASYCDPAGKHRREITGTAVTQELSALGIPTISRSSRILDGLELIRNYLAPACGPVRLVISPDCPQLIRAFQSLHYGRELNGQQSEVPQKDGVNDHPIDALRYFFINRFRNRSTLREARY